MDKSVRNVHYSWSTTLNHPKQAPEDRVRLITRFDGATACGAKTTEQGYNSPQGAVILANDIIFVFSMVDLVRVQLSTMLF